MANKLKLKKGDKVIVIAGNSKGSTGEILQIIKEKNRAIVEGVNMVKKHLKPTAENPQGGINELEASIHLSNLALVDPKEGKATRVGRRLNEEGKLERYAKKSNSLI